MHKHSGIVLSLGMALFCAVFVDGCANAPLSADPISSQVVDEDTDAPIEGAVVVAHWELHGGSLGGDSLPCGSADVEETVTDKDGRFHIPGWGPTRVGCGGEMRIDNPILYIFKSGYGYGFFVNGSGVEMVTVTHSDFDDRQLPLKKFPDMDLKKRGVGSYNFNFGLLNTALGNFTTNMPSACNWKKMPNMLKAIDKQAKDFDQALGFKIDTIDAELESSDSWFQKVAPLCGSPKEFIEALLKNDAQLQSNAVAH